MASRRVRVTSSAGSYAVRIDWGLLAELNTALEGLTRRGRPFVVSNALVWRLHGAAVRRALPGAHLILIPDGERHKHTQTVGRIYDALVQAEADRHAIIVALGGGVVGDTAGFAAATFLRGVALVHVPTTLLAQVDSAIGGKVGVNHALGKNLIGAFHPPKVVLIDPQLLETLPRRQFRAGLYEVVKYGVIDSPRLFRRVQQSLGGLFGHAPLPLSSVILESCRIKGRIVGADEREAGARRILNFGHTIGHALEAVTKYRRFLHGEAVAYGMLGASAIAHARGSIPASDHEALVQLIATMGPLPAVADVPMQATLEAMRRDKKVAQGRLHFILPTAIGRVDIVNDVTVREIRRALKTIGMRA